MTTQNTLNGSQLGLEGRLIVGTSFDLPDRKDKRYGHQNCVCPLLFSVLCQVWHPPTLQEEVDPGVDDGDHHQGEDELEDP